ncbi:AraC family transcriptional regulator [Streptomyces sp. GbtcB7]|uniref:helix-turn-helix domain-containing protein n=1 Tax=Streptomyces sp. GbtcB7 TaxID=2824752 RepID=UPI001C30B07E|nr:helix-turn-helix domain-containing protein [Streptomyces sp. GbtcB7]
MVNPGHGEIAEFGFHPPHRPQLGIEATTLAEIVSRVPGRQLSRPHRTDFHALFLITAGRGEHLIDFVAHPCRPGTLLWVRPGQVQSFGLQPRLDGGQLLFTTTFPPQFSAAYRMIADWFGPARWQLHDADLAAVGALFEQIGAECARPADQANAEIAQHLLAALLLEIDRLPTGDALAPTTASSDVFTRFHAELERSYAHTRRAEDYADRLGYTVKSLTRACLTATGHPVKYVIDSRVTLQAKRLLAHTDDPIALIARHLGFTEATNFGKFFTRHTGMTPGAFREQQRS